MADQPKTIISTSFTAVLGWHIWTILSLSGTTALLYLNFSKYSIGGELGSNASSTANILGILQVVVKAHELAIVASIVTIAQQCILRDLLTSGLLLGLLGAETALTSPSFLLSTRFRLALRLGCRSLLKDPARRRTLRLVALLFVCCVIAALAGPASAVLMIPRVDWFHYRTVTYSPAAQATLPTIMIGTSPGFLDGDAFSESSVFAFPDVIVGSGIRYWKDISGYELRSPRVSLAEKSLHRFHDYYGQVAVNTTGSYERPLDGVWTGGTRITTTTRNNDELYDGNWADIPLLQITRGWTDVMTVDTTHGLDASVTCRARTKVPCAVDLPLSGNWSFPDWCYQGVQPDNSTGELRTGRNLLLSRDFVDGLKDPRVWLSEGPRIAENQHYSDSLEVVFERPPDGSSFMHELTVCSFTAVLVAAVATSYGTEYTGEKVEYLPHVTRPDGTTGPPRRFLFHENWLDRAYSYDPTLWLAQSLLDTPFVEGTPNSLVNYTYPTGSMAYPDNFTYAARPGLHPQANSFGIIGSKLIYAVGYLVSGETAAARNEAFPVEATVGGMLTYLLSWTLPSDSQYSMPYDQIPLQFQLDLPESFSSDYVYEVYRRGYGFQLSTRTGYLGVAVLLAHAAIAIGASLWQILGRRGVVRAWGSVPDYVCLGSGSPGLVRAHPNTCAGVTGADSLGGLVKVGQRGAVGPPHLEIVAAAGHAGMASVRTVDLGDDRKRYGFCKEE